MHRSPDQKMEEGTKLERRRSCYRTAVEVLKKKGFNRLWLVSTLHSTGVLFDFLLMCTIVIYAKNKKFEIELNRSLVFTAFAFRSLLEILKIIIFCTMFNFKKFNFKNFMAKLLRKDAMKYMSRLLLGIAITRKELRDFLLFHQFLSILLVGVVWQVMLMISLNSSNESLIFGTLLYLVSLHIPRLCTVIATLLKRPEASSRFRTQLLLLFFLVFLYSNQLFAALWYVTASFKETLCWNEAHQLFPNNTKNFDNYCSRNTTQYNFGIYTLVHQSGILEQNNTSLKYLYFSRWALQYLSNFAQGLEAGDSGRQNIFIIFIIVYAVFMFSFLIGVAMGEIQVWLQSEKEKLAKWREKKKWMGKKNVPMHLLSQLREIETKVVNIEDVFKNLPTNFSGILSQQLCLERIKKVEEFGKWSEASLEELCDCIKPVFYAKGTRVIREGDPIDEMIFVVQGVLWSYPCGDRTMGSPSDSHCNRKIDHLKEGDFNGQELANWVRADPYSSDFPISTKNIQAVTNVDAFILMAYDLKNVFIKHIMHAVFFIQSYWRFKRLLRSRRNAQILSRKQTPQTAVSAVL